MAITGAVALLEALVPHLPKAEAADGEARGQLMPPLPPPPLSSAAGATTADPGLNPSQLLLPGQVITLQVVPYRQ
jgi:hypothetical protein